MTQAAIAAPVVEYRFCPDENKVRPGVNYNGKFYPFLTVDVAQGVAKFPVAEIETYYEGLPLAECPLVSNTADPAKADKVRANLNTMPAALRESFRSLFTSIRESYARDRASLTPEQQAILDAKIAELSPLGDDPMPGITPGTIECPSTPSTEHATEQHKVTASDGFVQVRVRGDFVDDIEEVMHDAYSDCSDGIEGLTYALAAIVYNHSKPENFGGNMRAIAQHIADMSTGICHEERRSAKA